VPFEISQCIQGIHFDVRDEQVCWEFCSQGLYPILVNLDQALVFNTGQSEFLYAVQTSTCRHLHLRELNSILALQ